MMKNNLLGAQIGNKSVLTAPIRIRPMIVFRRPTTSKITPLRSRHGIDKNEAIVAAFTFNTFAWV